MTMPEPTPVPMMMPNTTRAEGWCWRTAPRWVSARAKQFASLAISTGTPSRRSRSSLNGLPLSSVVLQFFINPVWGSRAPGVPMPMTAGRWPSRSAHSSTSFAIWPIMC